MNRPKIKIDVISDVVCPWCYIGKRRLERAIDQLKEDLEFEIHYHPFELNPNVPKEGLDQKAYLSKKFGSEERYEEIVSYVTKVASAEGLTFDFGKQTIYPNTMDAHRIIWLAEKEGKQLSVAEAFFKAYFEEGLDLTHQENLIQIATNAGLEKEKVKELLATDQGLPEVKDEKAHNQKIGVTGVPFYIINDQYSISGAQPSEVFIEAFTDIALKSNLQGESCELGGNC